MSGLPPESGSPAATQRVHGGRMISALEKGGNSLKEKQKKITENTAKITHWTCF